MNNPLEQFRTVATERGGLWFFKPADALKIISSLEGTGVRILGLDAFLVTGDATQPIMEHSADFSRAKEKPWDAARRLLETKVDSDLMFEFILDD